MHVLFNCKEQSGAMPAGRLPSDLFFGVLAQAAASPYI
jgi:hypothetical protein